MEVRFEAFTYLFLLQKKNVCKNQYFEYKK